MGGRRGRFFREWARDICLCRAEIRPQLQDAPSQRHSSVAEQPPTWKENHPWDTTTWISVCNTQDSRVRDSAGPVWGAPVGPSLSRPKQPGKPARMVETVLRRSGEKCWENGGTFPSPSIFSRRVKGFLAVSWEKMRICKRRLALSPLRVKS